MENDTIVERRQRYIERQRQMRPETVNVLFKGRSPEGSGPANRHGMPAVPVGQHLVTNWPVLDLGEQPDVPLDTWKLEIGGLVENPRHARPGSSSWRCRKPRTSATFTASRRGAVSTTTGRACRFRTIAELVVPQDSARHVLCTGYDFLPGSFIPYTVNVPLARAIEEDVLLVHTWEGQPLPREHGGPVRMITPKLYAWKGAKWIRKIEFLAEDKKGSGKSAATPTPLSPGSTTATATSAWRPHHGGWTIRTMRPMLATLEDAPLENDRLVYEPKYDGIRALVDITPGSQAPVRIWSRLGNEKTAQFPDLVAALARYAKKLKGPVVLDGEIVALDDAGEPAGFQRCRTASPDRIDQRSAAGGLHRVRHPAGSRRGPSPAPT